MLAVFGYYLAYVVYAVTVIFYISVMVIYFYFVSNFRAFIRNKYNIPKSCDCGVMCCCLPCAIAQMYTHVYAENKSCSICSDPGPHADGNGGMVDGNTQKMVTVVAQPQPVALVVAQPAPAAVVHVVAVAQPQPAVAVAQPQPVAVAVAQPQPLAVTAL